MHELFQGYMSAEIGSNGTLRTPETVGTVGRGDEMFPD